MLLIICVERLLHIGSYYYLRKWRRRPHFPTKLEAAAAQSVNFGRHLTEILYPFEISYQIFIHILPYQYLSFRNFTLPKFSFEKSYLTKIFFSEMLRNFTIIKVSVNRLYVNVTLRKLR